MRLLNFENSGIWSEGIDLVDPGYACLATRIGVSAVCAAGDPVSRFDQTTN